MLRGTYLYLYVSDSLLLFIEWRGKGQVERPINIQDLIKGAVSRDFFCSVSHQTVPPDPICPQKIVKIRNDPMTSLMGPGGADG